MNLRTPLKCLLLVDALFFGLQAYSQSTDCLTRPTVITVVGRRDKDLASPVASLGPEDLRIKIGGKNVSVESATHPSKPLRVSVVLDIGSGQSKLTWDATRLIVHNFPSHFPEGTEFSLVAFDDGVEQKVSLQKGLHVLDDFVNTLSPSKNKESKAGLYAGLAAGLGALGAPQEGDAVFLVTSWEDTGSDLPATIVQSLAVGGVRLIGISFDFSRLPGGAPKGEFVSPQAFSPIDKVAKVSGGLWIRASGNSPILESLPKIAAAVIGDFYTLGLKLMQPLVKPEEMRIELVKGGKISLKPNLSLKDVILSYPQAIFPCR